MSFDFFSIINNDLKKIDVSNLAIGNFLFNNNKLFIVSDITHTVVGRGSASYQVKVKPLHKGCNYGGEQIKFRSASSVFVVEVYEYNCTFLYRNFNPSSAVVMGPEDLSYEQFDIPEEAFDEDLDWLEEGATVNVGFVGGKALFASVPTNIEAVVDYADASNKNSTASASYKSAVLKNGKKITVPVFIKSGEKIVVNIRDCSYVGRAKDKKD